MEIDSERLKFRRQFLLSNKIIDELQNWQHQQIGDSHLFAHPDLEVTLKEGQNSLILLLGYIFDPFHPEKTNADIISDVYAKVSKNEDLFTAIKPYTGRYVIIYSDQTSFVALHDPYAVREIYYCTRPNRVICGSQPNLLVRYSEPAIEISRDPTLLRFFRFDMKPVRRGRLWVGDETVFEDVKHLRPNHYLDIRALAAKRYWPDQKLEKMDFGTAVRRSSEYLKGALKAVTSRYSVMMAVTSGFDSRSLLAASKEVSGHVYYFINKEQQLTEVSPDIRVPRAMFKALNLPFHIHDVAGPVDPSFKEIFLGNTFWAMDILLPTVYNVYFKAHQDKVNLLGLGEIGRAYYGNTPSHIDGYFLARSLKYKSSRYAVRQCERWLAEARDVAEMYRVDLMKLFLWEELIGNWGVVCNSESDIAIEEFDPYSSHYIGEIMISADRTERGLFIELFRELWPELLNFPINPPDTVADWIKGRLKRAGFFYSLQRQLYRIDRWRYRKLWRD